MADQDDKKIGTNNVAKADYSASNLGSSTQSDGGSAGAGNLGGAGQAVGGGQTGGSDKVGGTRQAGGARQTGGSGQAGAAAKAGNGEKSVQTSGTTSQTSQKQTTQLQNGTSNSAASTQGNGGMQQIAPTKKKRRRRRKHNKGLEQKVENRSTENIVSDSSKVTENNEEKERPLIDSSVGYTNSEKPLPNVIKQDLVTEKSSSDLNGEVVKKKRRRRRKKKSPTNNGVVGADGSQKTTVVESLKTGEAKQAGVQEKSDNSGDIKFNAEDIILKAGDDSGENDANIKRLKATDQVSDEYDVGNEESSKIESIGSEEVLDLDTENEKDIESVDLDDDKKSSGDESEVGEIGDVGGIGKTDEVVEAGKVDEFEDSAELDLSNNSSDYDYSVGDSMSSDKDDYQKESTGFSTGFDVSPMAKAMAEHYEDEYKANRENEVPNKEETRDSYGLSDESLNNEENESASIGSDVDYDEDFDKDLTFNAETENNDNEDLNKEETPQLNKYDDLSISDEDLDFEMNTNIDSNAQKIDDANVQEVAEVKPVNAPVYDVSGLHEEEDEIPFVEKPVLEKPEVKDQAPSITASTVQDVQTETVVNQSSVESVAKNVAESIGEVKNEPKKPEMPKIEEPKVENFSVALKTGLSAVFKRISLGLVDFVKDFFKGSGKALLFFPGLVWGWLSKFKIKYLIHITVLLGIGVGIYFVIISGFFGTLGSQISALFKSKPKEVVVIVKNTDQDLFNGYGLQTAVVFGGNDGAVNDRVSTAVNMAYFFGRLLEPKIAGETGISAALYYGKLGEMSEQLNLYVTYVKNLEKLQSIYSVNVYELLDRGTKRDKDLYDYLQKLKDSRDENTEVLRTINLNIDDLKNSYNSLNNDRTKYENDFFSAMDNLEAEKSDALLKTFIDIVQKQSALKARVGALTKLQTYYTTALAKLDKRITAVEQNEAALIKGVRVVDVPGGGVDVIIKPQATQ